MTIKIVLTADNHLDPPAVQFGPRRFEKRWDHMRAFEETVNYALKNNADLFLVCGDFFDTTRPGNYWRARVMSSFRRLDEASRSFSSAVIMTLLEQQRKEHRL